MELLRSISGRPIYLAQDLADMDQASDLVLSDCREIDRNHPKPLRSQALRLLNTLPQLILDTHMGRSHEPEVTAFVCVRNIFNEPISESGQEIVVRDFSDRLAIDLPDTEYMFHFINNGLGFDPEEFINRDWQGNGLFFNSYTKTGINQMRLLIAISPNIRLSCPEDVQVASERYNEILPSDMDFLRF